MARTVLCLYLPLSMALNNIGSGVVVLLCFITFTSTLAEDPYRFFSWNVTYGDIYPLGVRQQVYYIIYLVNFSLLSINY